MLNILFDLRNTGLGNGGGSQTLVKSANTLSYIGNNVIIIDSCKNQHTWNKLEVEHRIVKNINDIPNSDIVISTGFKSINPTLNLPTRCGKKLIWIRGWETWIFDEKKIINLFRNPIIKVVNSIGLQNKLNKYRIESFIIKPGNDFDNYFPLNIRSNKIIIGGLYHDKHRKTKNIDLIINVYKKLKKKYNIELWMMGNCNPLLNDSKLITKYFKQPSIKEKNKFYNSINIWLSTSELEGLHIPPQEAMLTECCIIGTHAELSGTKDYLIDNTTGLIYSDYNNFIEKIEMLIKDNNLREKLGKLGREKILSLGDREYNMKEFIKLMEKLNC